MRFSEGILLIVKIYWYDFRHVLFIFGYKHPLLNKYD